MTATGDRICQEISRLTQEGRPLDEILSHAVQALHDAHPLFHWTGVYELFPDQVLRLGPFVGAPTNHVFICSGQGVCGSAVAQKRNINVPDVSKATNYLACSQETKSELVILIRRGDHIFGQIDIDSHEYAAFDEEAEALVVRVADCLASAYQKFQGTPVRTPGERPVHDD